MRRSSAPSQLHPAKRARFMPPLKSSSLPPVKPTAPSSNNQTLKPQFQSRSSDENVKNNLPREASGKRERTATDGSLESHSGFPLSDGSTELRDRGKNSLKMKVSLDDIQNFSLSQESNNSSQSQNNRGEISRNLLRNPVGEPLEKQDVNQKARDSVTHNSLDETEPEGDSVGGLRVNAGIETHDRTTGKKKNSSNSFKSPLCSQIKGQVKGAGFRSPLAQSNGSVSTPGFRAPQQHSGSNNLGNPGEDAEDDNGPTTRYFNVMWCKKSKKKHKKWEGDAVLVTRGRSVTLLDMEGKEIGRSTGYKTSELESLSEGESLGIGGKEIEVMGVISKERFTSGKCFQGAGQIESTPVKTINKPVCNKPFVKPHTGQQQPNTELMKSRPVAGPRFDPLAPGALVMPRPSSSHQWEHNKQKLPIVDVVVDPRLTFELRPHQREGVLFLYECILGMRGYHGQGAILADDMGLGKTLQCITLLWTLHKQGPYGGKAVVRKALIITPGSLVKNWMQEFKKWLGNERLPVYAVNQDKKVEEFLQSRIYPVLIISYEMFVRSYEKLNSVNFDLIICDEGHRLKNTNIKTSSLITSLPCRRRVVLTGTPIQNDLQEFYAIVEFCNPGILGSSGAFRRVYEDPILAAKQPQATRDEKQLGETRAGELSRLTQLFILRRTQEINNTYLPPKAEYVVFCKPTALQVHLYRKLLCSSVIKSCLAYYSQVEGAAHLMCIAALKKLCNHPSLIHARALALEEQEGNESNLQELYTGLLALYPEDYDPSQILLEHSGKMMVLAALLDSLKTSGSKERIVVVSNYTQTLDLLERLCVRQNYNFLRLDGQTPTNKRMDLVDKFNSKHTNSFVFLLSSKAGGVGLNLIGASRLVLYDIDWNPANDLQAMARVWRDGQRKKVHIYRLITTGSIEEKIYQRQISKQGLSGVVVDAKNANTNVKFSKEDLRDLFTLDEESICSTHDLLQCECHMTGEAGKPASPLSERSCQLGGAVKADTKKNLSMDELMEWRHLEGRHPIGQVDPLLEGSTEQITFLFWNESNKEKLSTTDS